MLDLFNIAKPQGCDIQTFYGAESPSGTGYYRNTRTWTKPRGVSHVYMLLIGVGGSGDGTTGGGSGAVTVWYGAAQHVPDNLTLVIGGPGNDGGESAIYYRGSAVPNSTNYLLKAAGANITALGAAMAANQFSSSGFFQSVAGQNGNTGGGSQTSFLCPGDSAGLIIGNYGYVTGGDGFFQMQPIIVGVGAVQSRKGGIGSGGGYLSGKGGQGMILIASW